MKKIFSKITVLFYKLKYIFNKNISISLRTLMDKIELTLEEGAKFNIKEKSIISKGTIIRVRKNAKLNIGSNTGINNNVIITCRKHIEIGNNVLIGPGVMIFDNDHDYKNYNWQTKYTEQEIIIEDNVWIGCGAIILKGSHIQEGSVIGAGTVVKGTIAPKTIFYEEKNYIDRKFERNGK